MVQQNPLDNKLHILETAAELEDNIVHRSKVEDAAQQFKLEIWHQKQLIAASIRHHLRLRPYDTCTVLPLETWIQGSFNICVLVLVKAGDTIEKLIFRCPIPFIARQYPGTIDEKVSCEVATYIWMQEHCPDIRIPDLYAFGFTDGNYVRFCSLPVCMKSTLTITPVYTRSADISLHQPVAQGLAVGISVSSLSNSLRLHSRLGCSSRQFRIYAFGIYRSRDGENALAHLA